jgi:hypothetical protein
MLRCVLLALLLPFTFGFADSTRVGAENGICPTDSDNLMPCRVESADFIANKYWEELLLLDSRARQYANILPHLTFRAADDENLPNSSRVEVIIRQRYPLSNTERRLDLNSAFSIGESGKRYPALHLRLIPFVQELAVKDTVPIHRVGITAESWVNPNANLQVHLRARLENHGELHSQFDGRKWKQKITGWLDNAALYFFRNGFFGSAGRSYLVWGPEQQDALLISDNSPAFDRIWLGYEHKAFRFDYFIARLDDIRHNDSTLVRYISAHRLSFRKAGVFEVGLSEVALYGGYNRPIEWHYLNPFVPYYWEQYNKGTDDNLMLGVDLAVYWPRRARLFSELLIDDFQIDFVSEPQQVGYKLGIDALEPFGIKRLFTKISYTRVNTTVYGQVEPQNLYLNHGQPIGYFGGNDLDRFLARARYHLSVACDLELEFQYNRHGQGRIEQFPTSAVPKHVPFPSGIVEQSPSIRAAAEFFRSQTIQGHAAVSYAHFSNYQNVCGKSFNRVGIDLLLSYYLQGLFD